MYSRLLKRLSLICLCSLCGCQLFRPKSEAPPDPPATEVSTNKTIDLPTRNNALALLDDLLNDEKNLGKVLLIKHHSEQLGKLVKDISAAAGQGAKMVDSMAKTTPGLDLKQVDLPQGETATRKAISKSKEHMLLHSADAEFELQLLLTQVEALNYGANLAQVAADNESDPERVRQLSALSAQLKDLDENVITALRIGKS
jgi:hypothetical protein